MRWWKRNNRRALRAAWRNPQQREVNARTAVLSRLLGVDGLEVLYRASQLFGDGVCRNISEGLDRIALDGYALPDGRLWVEGADDASLGLGPLDDQRLL